MYMASVGFFRRPNTLPVHPLASPCTPGHRGIAGDGSGSPRRVRSLCGLGARRPGRAIRPREADTQTRPGRSWPRLRGVDARAPQGLCNHCQEPRSRTTIQGITCGPGSSLGVTGGHVGTAGEAIWRLQKCHRGHIQKCPHRKKTCLYSCWQCCLDRANRFRHPA